MKIRTTRLLPLTLLLPLLPLYMIGCSGADDAAPTDTGDAGGSTNVDGARPDAPIGSDSSADGPSSTDGGGKDGGGLDASDGGASACTADQHVSNHLCVACGAGSTNAAGDDPAGADTSCDATLCATNQRVQAHACSACAAGSTNVAGDDASGADTTCDGALCAVNQRVTAHACAPCAAGSTRAAGDDATGADTTCAATLCTADHNVTAHACVACLAGSTRAAGDDATGVDTTCTATLCAADQNVTAHACVACPAGTTNAAGDDATGANTTCDATLCAVNQNVVAHACAACPANSVNAAGDDASGADTACDLVETDVCGTAPENGTVTLTCYGGAVITSVSFASYGTPTGACGAYAVDNTCNAGSSSSVVTTACNRKTTCAVTADNATFTDPCFGVGKTLDVQAHCGLCGNSAIDPGEVCDDGFVDGLFCNSTCTTQPVVGNIRVNCDGAAQITDQIHGSSCVNLVGSGPSWLSMVAGVHATVYDTADCVGKTKTINATETNFCITGYDQGGSLNDTVRSIRIQRN
ncbi:MAG: hypothetical protein JWO86_5107 [Myxococcaceae bacterium]|jgi:hypothetical protein|nr:hypothetical protein [Myxococcaceae bacterium]MEA2749369.1 hypothetical protein [Myxococcales bacterium]